MRRGTNLPSIGTFNRSVVLDAVRRSDGGISRVELAASTGLSPQTITNVTRRLLQDGLIREAGKLVDGPGKPRLLLALEPRSRYAVGVHLDPSFITSVVTDLQGHVVADLRIRTPRRALPELVLDRMITSLDDLMTTVTPQRERFLGIGIAAPGPIDAEGGSVLTAPLLEGWKRVPLRDSLAEALRLPVGLEKDVTAAATAHAWRGRPDAHDFAFLYYGTGVGAGLVIGGEVVRGNSANAGDLGHIQVSDRGPLCGCGHRGCIGDNASPAAMVRSAARAGIVQLPQPPLRNSDVDRAFTTLTHVARAGDPAARRIVDRVARDLARAIVVLSNLLDLESVVIGGPYWDRLEPLVIDQIEAMVNTDTANILVHPLRVTSSDLGIDVAAVGAATLVLDSIYSPRPSGLLIQA